MPQQAEQEFRGLGDPRRAEIWQVLTVIVLLTVLSLSGFYIGAKHRGIAPAPRDFSSTTVDQGTNSQDWPPAGFTEWPSNSNISYMTDTTASCVGQNTNGCGVVQIVTQTNCTTLSGSVTFTLSGADVESVNSELSDVIAGPENMMEFDTAGTSSDSYRIDSIECTQ